MRFVWLADQPQLGDLGMTLSRLGVLGVFVLLCAGGVRADIIDASATGLSNPGQTITFDEHQFPAGTSITNQYADLGVTFSPNVYYSPQTGYPNIQGNDVGNFSSTGQGPIDPVTMNFSATQSSVAFAMAADGTPYTFQALLNGTVVDSFTDTVGFTSNNDFYGFTNDTFNSISITRDTAGGGPFWLLDNLQTSGETFGASLNAVVPGTDTLLTVDNGGFTRGCLGGASCDPLIKINLDGHSTPITGGFTLTTDAAGNIVNGDKINDTGSTINNIFIQTTLDPVLLQQGYGCITSDPTTAFGECGFRVDPNVPNTLDILFDDAGIPNQGEFNITGSGWILSPVSTPEPGSWALLLTVVAGLLVCQRFAARSRS